MLRRMLVVQLSESLLKQASSLLFLQSKLSPEHLTRVVSGKNREDFVMMDLLVRGNLRVQGIQDFTDVGVLMPNAFIGQNQIGFWNLTRLAMNPHFTHLFLVRVVGRDYHHVTN